MQSTLAQLKFFWVSGLALLLAIATGFFVGGSELAAVVALLTVLEVSLSFDNAVINAAVLKRLNRFWQQMFLTVGMVVAVFGMRLVLPIVVVAVAAGLAPMAVVDLALFHPQEYADKLSSVHPVIAAFGALFLFMVFLDFMLDEAKRQHWIDVLEEPLARAGRLKTLSTTVALVALVGVSGWAHEESSEVLLAGVLGLITYLLVKALASWFEGAGGVEVQEPAVEGPVKVPAGKVAGKAAFMLFLYLQVLDGSLSFDGVVTAFVVTSNVLAIALGLGVGALFVRTLTVWLVRHDVLRQFVYLEHGAHYAIGALSVIMIVSIKHDVPDVVSGLVGVGFLVLALVSSLKHRYRSLPEGNDRYR